MVNDKKALAKVVEALIGWLAQCQRLAHAHRGDNRFMDARCNDKIYKSF